MADLENQIDEPLKSNQYKVLGEMLHTCMILHECNTQIAYLVYPLKTASNTLCTKPVNSLDRFN